MTPINKIVNFWVEKSFRTPLNQNNGDNSPMGAMTFSLMNMVASKAIEKVSGEQIAKFSEKLESLLIEQAKLGGRIYLSVDYHPDSILSDACKFAGISAACLPCKSSTWIDDEIAYGRYQYGGKHIEL